MKYCYNCGTALEDNAEYCYKCGSKQIMDEIIQEPQYIEKSNNSPQKANNKIIISIAAIMVAVIALGIGLACCVHKNSDDKQTAPVVQATIKPTAVPTPEATPDISDGDIKYTAYVVDVDEKNLFLKEYPSLDDGTNVIGEIAYGEKVECAEISGEFTKVKYNGQIGYCRSNALSYSAPITKVQSVQDAINLVYNMRVARSEADYDDYYGKVYKGEEYTDFYLVQIVTTKNANGEERYKVYKSDDSIEYIGVASDWSEWSPDGISKDSYIGKWQHTPDGSTNVLTEMNITEINSNYVTMEVYRVRGKAMTYNLGDVTFTDDNTAVADGSIEWEYNGTSIPQKYTFKFNSDNIQMIVYNADGTYSDTLTFYR
jgi:hypothetical protein